jgi:hypothetical protein
MVAQPANAVPFVAVINRCWHAMGEHDRACTELGRLVEERAADTREAEAEAAEGAAADASARAWAELMETPAPDLGWLVHKFETYVEFLSLSGDGMPVCAHRTPALDPEAALWRILRDLQALGTAPKLDAAWKTADPGWTAAEEAFGAAEEMLAAVLPEDDTPISDRARSIAAMCVHLRDALFNVRAPHGVALALKISQAAVAGDLGGDLRDPEVVRRIELGDDLPAKMMLSCYRDALGLGGVRN